MAQTTILNRIKKIQTHIGVAADGVIGTATLTALENTLFTKTEDILQTGSLAVSRKGVDLIITHEISSKAYYQKFLSRPIWPKGGSGVTVGIGYDLGYHTPNQIQKDWAGQLKGQDLEALCLVAGKKGQAAKAMLDQVRHIPVPFTAAREVFFKTALDRHGAKARKAYPGVEDLFPDTQAAMLSLVYNRGTAMAGARRKEMAAIKPLVVAQDYFGIADQILAMKRLWKNKGLDGLLRRREAEAMLVRESNRDYAPDEIIRV
jgi:hypothetical protein